MNDQAKTWTAALAVIGDEILSGRTQDRNVAQLAIWLNEQGIRLAEVRIVPDDADRIYARNLEVPSGGAIGTARAIARAYSVFATGGRELGVRPVRRHGVDCA